MSEAVFARINKFLTVIVVALGLYIALMPFYPHFQLLIDRAFDNTDGFVYRSQLSAFAEVPEEVLAEPPEDNTLIIPSILVDEEVLVGDTLGLLDAGLWSRPNTSTPDKGGNTVIVGHRFAYGEDTPFYHLDQVTIGERIGLWWDGVEYIYEIREVNVVEPTAIEIEGKSEQNILTLYTCTPLWTASQRLVVRAILVNGPEVGLE